MSTSNQAGEKLTGSCFVVMGFGRKTDFETGRVLDLDLTYNYIIKPAIESAGLVCVRANEIKHSGPIDVPMYESLLQADVVFAFLLNTRAKRVLASAGGSETLRLRASAIADFVRADQVRAEVLTICERSLAALVAPDKDANPKATEAFGDTRYWIMATKAEAAQGVLDKQQIEQLYADAYALARLQWMIDSTKNQRDTLEALLAGSPLQHVQA